MHGQNRFMQRMPAFFCSGKRGVSSMQPMRAQTVS